MESDYEDAVRRRIAKEFEYLGDKVYLDFAGSGLYSSHQIQAVSKDLCENLYGNPHSLNDASRLCSDIVDQMRVRILNFFGTTQDDYTVIFTSGATGAIKLLFESFNWSDDTEEVDETREGPSVAKSSHGNFVYTKSNHTSVVGGRLIAENANVFCLSDQTAYKLLGKDEEEGRKTLENVTNGSYNMLEFNIFSKKITSNDISVKKEEIHRSNSLFAYPAQCNFSGHKFPLHWAKEVRNHSLEAHPGVSKNSNWFCLLDAAAFCATSPLNLSKVDADFVCVSFYKIFGYPTGLGALLVRNKSAVSLRRRYFGGGTVDVVVPSNGVVRLRSSLHERFEDGTIPYLSIIALGHGFDTLDRLGLTMQKISLHVFNLAAHTIKLMQSLKHFNGKELVEVYAENFNYETHSGTVAFNLKRSDGSYIGYSEVLKVSNSAKILLRTGCFCNIGACQKYLEISDKELLSNFQMGHVCGDDRDIINDKTTGAVRISFGYPSTSKDVHAFIHLIRENFLERQAQPDTRILTCEDRVRTLGSIRLYPVKSCGAQVVPTWRVTSRGLHLDRTWMVVTSSGVCLTQKDEPMMCCIKPTVNPLTKSLQLTYKGEDPIEINYIIDSPSEEVNICSKKVCMDHVKGIDCGDRAADWLERHLNRTGLRLIQQKEDDGRTSDQKRSIYSKSALEDISTDVQKESGKLLSLANQAQFLVINSASIEWLKEKIPNEPEFDPNTLQDRFRANFIVNGRTPLEEADWRAIRMGKLSLNVDGPCTRCQMICIDQTSGEKNRKPLVELSRALGGKLRFGVYCSHDLAEGIDINVGDEVIVGLE